MKNRLLATIFNLLAVFFFLNSGGLCFAEFSHVSEATCIDGPLRIREQPTTSSLVLGALQNGEEVEVLSRTFYLDKIGRYKDFWYYISNSEGLKGYVFGQFIKIEETQYNRFLEMNDGGIVDGSRFFNEIHETVYILDNIIIHYAESDITGIVSGRYNHVSIELESRRIYVMNNLREYGWIDLDEYARTQPYAYDVLREPESKREWFYKFFEKEYELSKNNNIT